MLSAVPDGDDAHQITGTGGGWLVVLLIIALLKHNRR